MLKVITGVRADEFENSVNEFVSSRKCDDISYAVVDSMYVAFINYREIHKTSATEYYENSDNMTMEEVLHDAC